MLQVFRRTALVFLLSPAVAAAQVSTMDFNTISHSNYDHLAQSFGDRTGLNVSNTTRSGSGNTAEYACTPGPNSLLLWNTGYSSLAAAALPCWQTTFGELSFTPDVGKKVTLQSLWLGAYNPPDGGLDITLQIFNSSWTSVYSYVGKITESQNIFPDITSESTLYLQWGADWNTGVNLITTNIEDITSTPPTTVPEPSTVALMASGLAAVCVIGRKRARTS